MPSFAWPGFVLSGGVSITAGASAEDGIATDGLELSKGTC